MFGADSIGDLADYFRYGLDTGPRPENPAERQLSDFLSGQTSQAQTQLAQSGGFVEGRYAGHVSHS
jgi:hypothetical protein